MAKRKHETFLELCGKTGTFEANVRDAGLDIQRLRALYVASSLPTSIKLKAVRYNELKAIHLQEVAAHAAFFSKFSLQISYRIILYMDSDLFRFLRQIHDGSIQRPQPQKCLNQHSACSDVLTAANRTL